MKQRIVTVGADPSLQASLTPIVDNRAAAILSVPSAASACALHETVGIDLLIIVSPLDDLPFDDFVEALSASSLPHIVVIAGEDEFEALSQRESDGLDVLSASLPVSELVSACRRLVRTSPRAGQRLMARLEVKLETGSRLRMAQVSDISATGMKVATNELVPIGTWIKFTFHWPDDPDPISGDAEVMRHTSKKKERVHGMGLRFTAFDEHNGERLREHIRERVERDEIR